MPRFDPVRAMADARHEFGEHGGVNLSVEASTTFTVLHARTLPEIFHGDRGPEEGCYLYGRHFNPTVYVLARQLAAMEGTDAAYCTASGMSAIAAPIMQLCNHGDRVVAGNTIYGGTFALLKNYLPGKMGLGVSFVDVTDLEAVEAAFTPKTRVLFVETQSNPTLVVADIPRLAEIAHRHDAQLVVDNTFCPMIVSPAQWGADVVVHSLTKFISGSSDIIAGAVCGSEALIRSLMDVNGGGLMLLGPTMDPFVAEKLSLRLPHLGIRMAEHCRRAQVFAERITARGMKCGYPGLPSHPQHALMVHLANQGFGYGGILDVDLETADRANELLEILQNRDRFGLIAVSLGYFDTLMSVSASSTSSELDVAAQHAAHISPGLARISIGYTGTVEQRWEQFEDALRVLDEAMPSRKSG
jgi:methionine-gamma-lyase